MFKSQLDFCEKTHQCSDISNDAVLSLRIFVFHERQVVSAPSRCSYVALNNTWEDRQEQDRSEITCIAIWPCSRRPLSRVGDCLILLLYCKGHQERIGVVYGEDICHKTKTKMKIKDHGKGWRALSLKFETGEFRLG